MKLKVIGSGSSGNCYALESETGEVLLLDCGMPVTDIKKALNWNIKNIVGCVVTHGHSDHLKPSTYENLWMSGIRIEKPYTDAEPLNAYCMGDFVIHTFEVPHDGTDNRGMMIRCDGKTLLYITDSEYVRYNFKKFEVDYIICECNFQDELVDMEAENLNHIYRGHMSLETCIDFLKANATDKLRHIILCHLSKVNADPIECQMAVCKAIPNVMVHVAYKGLELQF